MFKQKIDENAIVLCYLSFDFLEKRWLTEFEFTDIATANQQIDWTKVQHFSL